MLKQGRPLLIYLHGFNSSPASHKARYLEEYLASRGRVDHYLVPALDYRPAQAIESLEKIIKQRQNDCNITLIGSSLGGYYATFLTEKFGVSSVLINPAVAPYRMFAENLGRHENFYTGESYEITPNEVQQLREIETQGLRNPALYRVLLQTGDETLDYREAASKYEACSQDIQRGGSHGFDDFDTVVPEILAFAGLTNNA